MTMALCAGVTACSSPARAPATTEGAGSGSDEQGSIGCAAYGRYSNYGFKQTGAGQPAAIDDADRETTAAIDAGDDHASAAAHYLACARAYSGVPADFDQLDHVVANTRNCYLNALAEYIEGGLLEREGRAAIKAALATEHRAEIKDDITAQLADAKDCPAD
jgi:hypothetical protein